MICLKMMIDMKFTKNEFSNKKEGEESYNYRFTKIYSSYNANIIGVFHEKVGMDYPENG